MKRNTLNYLLDGALALTMTGLLATGLLMWLVLPHRSGRVLLWGWNRHDWGDLHLWLSIIFVAVLLLHLALHWQWICTTTLRLFSRRHAVPMSPLARNLLGVLVLLAFIGLCAGFVRFAKSQVTPSPSINSAQLQSPRQEPGHGARLRLGRNASAP